MRFRFETGTKPYEFSNVALDGFNIRINSTSDTVNTFPGNPDLSKIKVRAILEQGGEKYEILSSTLLPIFADYIALKDMTQNTISSLADATHNTPVTVVNKDVTVKGVRLWSVPVRFGSGIVLKGSDKLEVTVTVLSNAYATGTEGNYVEVEANEVVTNQTVVPFIEVLTLPSTESYYSRTIGDNVQTLSLINIDKANLYDSPWQNVKLDSDRLEFDKEFSTLWAEKVDAGSRGGNSVVLLHGQEFDDVNLAIDIATANATNEMNYIVYRHFDTNDEVYDRGAQRHAKHQQKALRKRMPMRLQLRGKI